MSHVSCSCPRQTNLVPNKCEDIAHLRYDRICKVSKGAKIRNRYNKVPHLTQDAKGKVTNSQLDTTNESQEVSPFRAGDHKAYLNRGSQRHSKHMTEQKHKRFTEEVPPYFTGGLKPDSRRQPHP